MQSGDYLPFLDTMGWLAALALAALLPSLPGVPGRGHAVWLIAFCATRLLVEAQGLIFPGAEVGPAGNDWRQMTAIFSGMLLWEFARRIWNDHAAPRIRAVTHVVGAECIALLLAVSPSSSGGRPTWFAPVEIGASLLPALLGGASALVLWRCASRAGESRYRHAVRLAAVGLGLFQPLNGVPVLAAFGVFPPWLVVVGLGAASFALPAARTRAALACGIGLLFTALLGPLGVALILERVEITERADLLTRAQRAATHVPRTVTAQLHPEGALSPELSRILQQLIAIVRLNDPLLHAATLWQLRSHRVWIFEDARDQTGRFVDARAVRADELSGAAKTRPFLLRPEAGNPYVTVHAPLRVLPFDTPAAWIALEYPEAFWAVQRRNARRSAVALLGLLAGFCVMGFVLASRQAIENAQRLAIERAQSADKAKTEFLAFLSHEMRTPLQTILGRTELLHTGAEATDASRRHATAIETQGRLLLRLVTDLLDLGTLEAGKFQLRPHPFSLRLALTAVEDTIRAPVLAKQLALAIVVAPDVPDHLVGDETRLRQVLGNILGNAVKYTARGQVRFTVETEPGEGNLAHLVFRVADSGPGLPPDRIPQLFTLFTRLDSGETFTREGTGVGLALVRRLCELMGGTAAAANRPEGGAEFTVRLAFPIDENARGAHALDATPGAAPTTGLRVLVAEDNAAAREFLVEALQSLGHHAEGADDGPAALALATAHGFDAVLLDVNLPGRDGVSIARTLTAQPDRPRLIGCSAEAFAHTRDAALAAGMDAFLEKPVSLAALASALQPAAAPAGANLFERLRAPELIAKNRAALARDLPATVASLRAAHEAGDPTALRRQTHFLLSTALLADNATLIQLCRRLEQEADAGANGTTSTILSELARHAGSAPP